MVYCALCWDKGRYKVFDGPGNDFWYKDCHCQGKTLITCDCGLNTWHRSDWKEFLCPGCRKTRSL